MRGDRVGVRDVGDLYGESGDARQSCHHSDGRIASRKCYSSVLYRHEFNQLRKRIQQTIHRFNIVDGAWIRAGTGGADGDGTSRADGMRGDGVGVGDVGAVHDGGWSSGHACCCDDGRRARRVDQHGGFNRRRNDEHISSEQHGRDGVGVGDGAWIRAGTGGADGDGTRRADGMRGNGVGVGDVDALHDGRPGSPGHAHCSTDGR